MNKNNILIFDYEGIDFESVLKLLQEIYCKKKAWTQTEAQVILMLKIWAKTNRK